MELNREENNCGYDSKKTKTRSQARSKRNIKAIEARDQVLVDINWSISDYVSQFTIHTHHAKRQTKLPQKTRRGNIKIIGPAKA
ncbi:CLUMA_CG019808, isoform A [Clunio marinus]|uniref:CLUMA_CG019808, isoform A n=1 Tax=Clunio marinus TaxID=568069 RepID=A0A1J1J730_9DIPT|nr:CLUMA_CG019808, isoform A [Clunio marinus]